MLWQQASRVVALLDSGMSQRALAKDWINARTGRPYSQMHVSFTARAFEKFTFHEPRPKFRTAYNSVANATKREVEWQAHWKLLSLESDAADLRVSSCAELFAPHPRASAPWRSPARPCRLSPFG
jgi:hypothetical protein